MGHDSADGAADGANRPSGGGCIGGNIGLIKHIWQNVIEDKMLNLHNI